MNAGGKRVKPIMPILRATVVLTLALLPCAGGCANALAVGHSTALDATDLRAMTDRMAASIAGDPRVLAAVAAEGPLAVVVERVENRMTGEILPRPEAEAFTARVRSLLSEQARGQFVWCVNRETYERLRGGELDPLLGPPPDRVRPRYVLWGQFYSLTNEDAAGRRASYLCLFELTDLDRSTTLWTGRHEVSKRAVKGFLD